MNIKKSVNFRDLTLIELNSKEVLVLACDSLGGIGPKLNDQLKVPGEVVGIFTARVALMEVIASGAQPVALVNTLSVERNPTGAEIIQGIKKEIRNAGLETEIIINGSTEENMQTTQTGLGVTVIGKAAKNQLRLGVSEPGDLIVCLGTPKVGAEVLDGTANIDVQFLKRIMEIPEIKEVLPVGSQGIKSEAEQLAQGAQAKLKLITKQEIDLEKSAGPATCILVTLLEKNLLELRAKVDLPLYKIGYLEA